MPHICIDKMIHQMRRSSQKRAVAYNRNFVYQLLVVFDKFGVRGERLQAVPPRVNDLR